MPPLRILTWHVHGSYLYYLTQCRHEFFLPVKPDKPEGYGGRLAGFPWGKNVHDIPAEQVTYQEFDCILFQSAKNYLEDQYEILSEPQRQLPRIYLEHDPPQQHPTNTKHWVDDPNVLLVHVTPFNDLMWDSGATPTSVIEHGVLVPEDVPYIGELNRGIVVVNGLKARGRRLGADVFDRVRQSVSLDLIGMKSEELGGFGEIKPPKLYPFEARYRFFFNPIRYTSLGLAVCEAMMLGLPIVALATTEMATVVENGVSGYVDTQIDRLIEAMRSLLDHPAEAQHLSMGARRYALERFHIDRFCRDWDRAFALVTGKGTPLNNQNSGEPNCIDHQRFETPVPSVIPGGQSS
jgi:hypothetical protein